MCFCLFLKFVWKRIHLFWPILGMCSSPLVKCALLTLLLLLLYGWISIEMTLEIVKQPKLALSISPYEMFAIDWPDFIGEKTFNSFLYSKM